MNNTTNVHFDGIQIPVIPSLWYREDHIFLPPKNIQNIDPNIINNLLPNLNIKNNCFRIVQKNILENPNLYVSFHALSYYLDTKSLIIDRTFNKSYKWFCYAHALDQNILFFNGPNTLKNNTWCTGNAFIHDNAFSPPGDFKFSIKN